MERYFVSFFGAMDRISRALAGNQPAKEASVAATCPQGMAEPLGMGNDYTVPQ
jgi:hypothetical protein